jgi:hypothetical protein
VHKGNVHKHATEVSEGEERVSGAKATSVEIMAWNFPKFISRMWKLSDFQIGLHIN